MLELSFLFGPEERRPQEEFSLIVRTRRMYGLGEFLSRL